MSMQTEELTFTSDEFKKAVNAEVAKALRMIGAELVGTDDSCDAVAETMHDVADSIEYGDEKIPASALYELPDDGQLKIWRPARFSEFLFKSLKSHCAVGEKIFNRNAVCVGMRCDVVSEGR